MSKIQLIINNSYSRLIGIIDQKILKKLCSYLSYQITSGYWNGRFKFETVILFDIKTGVFPTGLLSKVSEFILNECGIEPIKIDRREIHDKNNDIVLPKKYDFKLRPYQKEIIDSCLKHRRGIVESATGTGKSIIICELIHKLRMPTLIVIPTLNIVEQMTKTIAKVFGKNKVGKIAKGGTTKRTDLKKTPIWVASVQSLPNLPQTFFDEIGVLIIDEFHHAAATTYQDLNLNAFRNIYHRFGFTGTNFRNDGSDLALQGVLSDVIYKYDAVQAIADGYLSKVKFVVYDFGHKPGLFNDFRTEYNTNIIENEDFHDAVAKLAIAIRDKKPIPTLILVKEIKHGEALKERIPNSMFISGNESPESSQKILKDFEAGKYSILIGTSCIGEGVDLPSAQIGIMAGGGKAKSEIIQKIGRFLRLHENKKEATIIDFIHEGSSRLWKHSRDRLLIYSKYGEGLISRRNFPIFN